jgi:FSR family fosmidomycin resistance protein-like MFS transporter
MIWTLVGSVPFLAAAPMLPAWGFAAMLGIGGLLLQSTLPVSVTFAQTFTRAGAATVSSLMMGFAWGMGSLAVPIIGAAADRIGINGALLGLSVVPLLAAALAAALPESGESRPEAVDSGL